MTRSPDLLLAARPSLGSEAKSLTSRVLARVVEREPLGGRYELGDVLGSGTFGVVTSAHDLQLDRRVAIKQLRVVDPSATSSIIDEARTLATLSHPNVVQVFEVGVDDKTDAPYVVMEYLDGKSLDVWLRDRARPWQQVVELVIQAARGLGAAHAAGVLHRDVKPANLLLGANGRLRVADFGLARVQPQTTLESIEGDNGDSGEVRTKNSVGTPAYLAPEGFQGRVGPASDQFSLAAVLFEGLTGNRAVPGATLNDIRRVHRRGIELPRTLPGGATLRRALARGLAKDPQQRHRSVDAFADALEDALRPRSTWTLAVPGLSAVALAAAVWMGSAEEPCTTDPAAWASALRTAGNNENLRAAADTYAEAWKAAEETACQAGTPLDSNVRLCLDGLRSDAEALLALHDEERWSDHVAAVAAVEGLGDPDDCAAEARKRRGPPDGSAARIEAVQPKLSRLRAMSRVVDDLEGMLPLSEDVWGEARAIGYAPLLADAASLRGRALMLNSELEEAREVWEEGYFAARDASLPKAAANIAAQLSDLVVSKFGDVEAGHRWVEHANAAFDRAGLDPGKSPVFQQALIALAQREGRFEDMERLARRSEQLEIDAGRLESRARAVMVGYRGIAQFMQEKNEAALATFEQAGAIAEARHGPRSAQVSAMLENRASMLVLLERYEEALPIAERALELREELYPPGSLDLAITYGNIATLYGRLGRFEEGLRYADLSIEFFTEELGPTSGQLARAYTYRAVIRWNQGKEFFSMARDDFRTALVLLEDAGDEFADEIPMVERQLAELEAAEE